MDPQTIEPAIHPSAIVDSNAVLGSGVVVGPYSVIEAGARIGDGCLLQSHVAIRGDTEIGAGTTVGTGSVLGGEPQDGKYGGEPTRVLIGRNCRIYEHVTVHRPTGEGETVVGDDVMLMVGSHVAHNCIVGDRAVFANSAVIGGHAQVGERAFLSAQVSVHQFGRVGRLTLVAAACQVTKDAPPFSIVAGAYPIRWRAPNTVGLRRADFSSERRTAVRRALSDIFRSGESPVRTAEALVDHSVPEVAELARFVLSSERGICAGPRRGSD